MSNRSVTEVQQKLTSVRMFLAVFAVVQAIGAGVVVFSVHKMNLALIREPFSGEIIFGIAALVLLLNAVFLRKVLLFVRDVKKDEPEPFTRFTSEVLIKVFLLNLPAIILVAGYALTSREWLLPPAAVGLVAIGFVRPNRAQYEHWQREVFSPSSPSER